MADASNITKTCCCCSFSNLLNLFSNSFLEFLKYLLWVLENFFCSSFLTFSKAHINYTIIVGLLWGAERPSTKYERQEVFNRYFDEMKSYKSFEKDLIIGIETCRYKDGLICKTCYQIKKNGATTISVAPIIKSFNLDSIE